MDVEFESKDGVEPLLVTTHDRRGPDPPTYSIHGYGLSVRMFRGQLQDLYNKIQEALEIGRAS